MDKRFLQKGLKGFLNWEVRICLNRSHIYIRNPSKDSPNPSKDTLMPTLTMKELTRYILWIELLKKNEGLKKSSIEGNPFKGYFMDRRTFKGISMERGRLRIFH